MSQSTAVRAPAAKAAAGRQRPRITRWLIGFGCALLVIGATWSLVEGTATPAAQQVVVQPELRASFAAIVPSGQSTGFAVAPDGTLGIVDRLNKRVLRLDANGATLAEWGPRFDGSAEAQDLSGLAVSGNRWYLLDRGRQQLLLLDPDGHLDRAIDLSSLATYGPNGLAVDSHDQVYMADTGGNRILVFNSSGAVVRTIGSAGNGLGQFKQPMSIAFGGDGSMLVTDFENSRIERWGADLQPAAAWDLPRHAWGVALDKLGRVFVPDGDERSVRVYSTSGDLLTTLPGLPIEFPTQVGVAPDGSALWVLGNNGLARIDLTPLAAVQPAAPRQCVATWLLLAGAALTALGAAPSAFALVRRRRTAVATPARNGTAVVEPVVVAAPPVPEVTTRARTVSIGGLALATIGGVTVAAAMTVLPMPAGKTDPWPGMAALVLGGLAWAVGCAASARALPWRWVSTPAATRVRGLAGSRTQWLALAAAVVLASVAAFMWWTGKFETAEATRAALVWVIAVALAGAAAGVRPGRPRRAAIVMVALFALALLPRLWQVADLPYGVWYDEAQGAVEIRRVVQAGTYTPILNTYGKDTSGFFYIMAGLWPALGDGIAAARGAAVVVGALNVVALYLLGRELFGWRVGVASALVLAFMRWHLNFSRLGFNPISLPLCATLAFWLLARSVRRNSTRDALLAGLALGVGLHAYTGFRGTAVVALLTFAYAAVLQRSGLRGTAQRVGAYAAGAVLVGLPVLIFAIADPVTFNGRTAQTLILTQPVSDAEKLRQLWDNVQRHALMFQVSGDMNGRHNLPGAPMLDALSGGLLMLGLGWLLIRLFNWRSVLLLGWAAVSLSGGILTFAFEAPQGARTIGVTPVLALLVGLGLVATLDRVLAVSSLVRVVRPGRAALVLSAIGALAIGAIGFVNVDTFFNRQMRDADVFASFSTRETVPAKFAQQYTGQYESILASQTMTPSVESDFLVPDQRAMIRQFDSSGDLPYRGQGPGMIFLETEHDQAVADEVARWYPDAQPLPIRPPNGAKPIVQGFWLSPEVLAAHRGASVQYVGADGSAVSRTESPLTLESPVALPAHVDAQAVLALDASGDYGFRTPPGLELRIDGATMPHADQGVRVRLVRGNHSLSLTGALTGPAQLTWLPPGAPDWQPLPAQAVYVPRGGGTGLQASVSTNGPAMEQYIDPLLAHYYHVSPFARLKIDPQQWTIEWQGLLNAPADGLYAFTLDHSMHATFTIDGQIVSGRMQLNQGMHDIDVRFDKNADGAPYLNLYWTPPGQPSTIVPASALYPPPPELLP